MDGGANEPYGSFGWVIHCDGKTLVEGSGATHRTMITSFWAEAYTYLSLMVYIKVYTDCYEIPLPDIIDLTLHTDSEPLIL